MNVNLEIPDRREAINDEIRISVRDLDLYYGDFQALRHIYLDIPKNAITAVIGPSGCGKSTFLRLLNRMNDLITGVRIEGSVELDGVNIYNRDIDVVELRKKVGMVFQKPIPSPCPFLRMSLSGRSGTVGKTAWSLRTSWRKA